MPSVPPSRRSDSSARSLALCTRHGARKLSLAGAFTLIELLVVIGIIALLAALIFPAINDSIRASRQSTSLGNLKQWSGAFMLAVGEFDNEMPSDGGPQFKMEDENAWFNRMPPFLQLPSLKKATQDQLPKVGQKNVWINPGASDTFSGAGVPFCYGFNDYLSTVAEPNMKVTRVLLPTKTILMAEKKVDDPSPAVNPDNIRTNFGTKDPMDPEALANVIFVDGHGEAVRRKTLIDPSTTKADTEEEHRQAVITWLPFEKATK